MLLTKSAKVESEFGITSVKKFTTLVTSVSNLFSTSPDGAFLFHSILSVRYDRVTFAAFYSEP